MAFVLLCNKRLNVQFDFKNKNKIIIKPARCFILLASNYNYYFKNFEEF